MLALAITSLFMLFANCPLSSISLGIPPKLIETFVILIGKTSVTIFLMRIGPVPVITLNVLWANWKEKFLAIVDSHAPVRTKRTG